MLSVILYGRNDNHGYNYHKRLAISLNCIAEMLSDPEDEIVFTDYNSPDEFPTLVEAIQDTLTDKAKKLIRVVRVRPSHHKQFGQKTHLPILEAVSRNIAIRRSNPKNKWILVTNTDMVFIPLQQNETLTTLAGKLSDGFYLLPRFGLPENFWELALDRFNPKQTISFLKENTEKLHINTVVRRNGFLKYDNPGDFQLVLRKDLFEMDGFDEEMVKGWHVDSNLCKRMALLGRSGESLEDRLLAFHCNHNQKESLFHNKVAENDWGRFVTDVAVPGLVQPNWGFPNEHFEEVRFNNQHLQALSSALAIFPKKTHELSIELKSFNTLTYAIPRVFSFLADHFCHLPKTTKVAYVGYNMELFELLSRYLQEMGFTEKPLCLNVFPANDLTSLVSEPYLTILDFGIDENTALGKKMKESREGYLEGKGNLRNIVKVFLEILEKKRTFQMSGKFIGINLLHTDFNAIFTHYLMVRNNGHAAGVSYGYFSGKGRARRKLSSTAHYLIARYLFNYSDRIRSFLSHRKIGKKLFKSLSV